LNIIQYNERINLKYLSEKLNIGKGMKDIQFKFTVSRNLHKFKINKPFI